jgi:hypothetical protein
MMRLIFVGGDCVKRIGGDAVMDVLGGVIVVEPPEAAGVPARLLKLIDGRVTISVPPPLTPEEIASAEARADLDAFMHKAFLVAFNHENRIRVLEGKPPVTREQLKAALIDL